MGKVVLDISVSLDGFIAGAGDTPENPLGRNGRRLHDWMSHATGELMQGGTDATIGAVLTGRRTYDLVNGWDGTHPVGPVPVFVLSKDVPDQVPQGGSAFTFVPDGAESAVRQAQAVAGAKNVYVVGGANAAQQCLRDGVLDEVRLHLVPVLLGAGIRLFDNVESNGMRLEKTGAVDGPDVVHLMFRVVN